MPEPDTLRVVIADDHPFYREGLAGLLRRSGIDVVAEAPDGEAAIRAVEEAAPDVVVMDLNMPGALSGVDATRRLAEVAPACRVLVLSVSAEEDDVTEAILAGATGYVLKDGPVEEVVAGIQAAARGHSLLSPRIASMLMRSVRSAADTEALPAAARLTARELEVLRLLADGMANHEIAGALTISLSTVRNHISSILLKLHVQNRVQAAVRAVRARLV